MSPQTRPLKNEVRTNQTSSSKTPLAAVWEVAWSQPETDQDSGTGGDRKGGKQGAKCVCTYLCVRVLMRVSAGAKGGNRDC